MSYNCDQATYVSGRLTINGATAKALMEKYEGRLPSENFFGELGNH